MSSGRVQHVFSHLSCLLSRFTEPGLRKTQDPRVPESQPLPDPHALHPDAKTEEQGKILQQTRSQAQRERRKGRHGGPAPFNGNRDSSCPGSESWLTAHCKTAGPLCSWGLRSRILPPKSSPAAPEGSPGTANHKQGREHGSTREGRPACLLSSEASGHQTAARL